MNKEQLKNKLDELQKQERELFTLTLSDSSFGPKLVAVQEEQEQIQRKLFDLYEQKTKDSLYLSKPEEIKKEIELLAERIHDSSNHESLAKEIHTFQKQKNSEEFLSFLEVLAGSLLVVPYDISFSFMKRVLDLDSDELNVQVGESNSIFSAINVLSIRNEIKNEETVHWMW